jgi:hypothetical protein
MSEKAVAVLLVCLLLWIPFLGYFGYYLAIGSDQYEVIRFAEDLAQGTLFRSHPVFDLVKDRTEPGRLYTIHYGGYLLKDGRMYCKYAIGYPLILALALKLFGFPAVFFVNFCILSLLLLVVYLIGRIYFRDEPSPSAWALSAAFLLFLLGRELWDLSVTPHGDVSCVLFAVAAVYALLRALPPAGGAKASWLVASGVCLGFAAAIRPPAVLLGLPAALYFLNRTIGKIRFIHGMVLAVALSGAVIAGLLPVFTQNYLTGGHILKFTQAHEIHLETVQAAVQSVEANAPPVSLGRRIADIFFQRSHGWGIGNIHAALPAMSYHILLAFGPFFSLLALGGLAAGWRRAETRYLFFPASLVFLLFYSGWVRPLERYLVIVYPFIGLITVGGIARLFAWSPHFGPGSRRRLSLALLGAVLAAADFVLRSANSRQGGLPHWQNNLLFSAALIPALSLLVLFLRPRRNAAALFHLALAAAVILVSLPVIAAKPFLFQFPQSRRFREAVGKICRPPSVLFATKFLTQTIDLFTDSVSIRPFDLDFAVPELNRAYGLLRGRGFNLYLIDNRGKRDAGGYLPRIRDYFAATPVGTLAGGDYNLAERFGKPACTVYAIQPWKDETVDLALATAAPVDYLLTLNLGRIWDTLPPRSSVAAFLNGAPFPARFENGVNFLLLSSASVGSPRSVWSVRSDRGLPPDPLVDLRWAGLDYVIDFSAAAPASGRQFIEQEEAAEEADGRTISGRARIAIPPSIGEGRRSAELTVRWEGGGERSAALDGIALGILPLRPSPLPQPVEIELPAGAGSPVRSWLEISGTSPLALESLRIKRWGDSFALPTAESAPYLLKAELKIFPGAGEVFLELNGMKLAGVSDGVRWELLSPAALRSPVSNLLLQPAASGARMHISLLKKVSYPFRVEPGSPSGREFEGRGWYSPELHLGETPFAWTAGAAEVYLPVSSVPAAGMELSLGYIGGRPPGVPSARVSVDLDGRPAGSFVPAEGMREAILRIPPELLRPGISRLTIRTNTWQPADRPSAGDTRILGLMLRYLEFSPRAD